MACSRQKRSLSRRQKLVGRGKGEGPLIRGAPPSFRVLALQYPAPDIREPGSASIQGPKIGGTIFSATEVLPFPTDPQNCFLSRLTAQPNITQNLLLLFITIYYYLLTSTTTIEMDTTMLNATMATTLRMMVTTAEFFRQNFPCEF